ncbi:MAG: hypothetical protein HYX97_01945, partial [Chloroflexi bacterium]|nr:hypothetical protein [Chloroflexota bacterium]
LSRLVGDLLAMSRIESGATARAERVPLDPAAVAQVGIDSVSSFTQHHKVRLEVDKALPTILGDSTQLEHVVANLVENAAKYSPRGKEVRVRVKRHGGEVVFSVADQGPGIAPEYHQKIFEKFYRVEVVGMPRAPGTGLGLSICKGIVEQHGGRIWIESALGHGATFSFALPAASSPIARRSAGKKGAIEGKKRS